MVFSEFEKRVHLKIFQGDSAQRLPPRFGAIQPLLCSWCSSCTCNPRKMQFPRLWQTTLAVKFLSDLYNNILYIQV